MLTLQEKIAVRGVESLSDAEVLSLLLGDDAPATLALAERLLSQYNSSLVALSREELSRLRMSEGIGIKSALRLKAAAEWGRRTSQHSEREQQAITSSADVVEIFSQYFSGMKHEECWVLYLSASNRIIERYRVSQGGVTATVVDHRLIVKRALELLSTNIVLVHNHPSGAAEPSAEDISLTQKIKSAATLFDISLLDHIIIAESSHYSFLGHSAL